jgi:hypothetical protein
MNYKGHEYNVVRTLSPNGWRWSIARDGADKIGLPPRTGFFRAKKFIDQLVKSIEAKK